MQAEAERLRRSRERTEDRSEKEEEVMARRRLVERVMVERVGERFMLRDILQCRYK